jgi:GABA permease
MTSRATATDSTSRPEPPSGALGNSLKPRHITMISIAGVIGAGLFVGSANAIKRYWPRWWSDSWP